MGNSRQLYTPARTSELVFDLDEVIIQGDYLTPGIWSDYLRIIGIFILPGVLAVTPVVMPFGTPFAKDGNNSVAINWAYYFWYTPIGWGTMWFKVVLWNAELFGVDFFFPFMHGKPGIFKCNCTILAVLFATVFSVALYVIGYLIFHNPVPLGTISFGVPCFLATFINAYFLVVPRAQRQSWSDNMKIMRCWFPFIVWILGLVLFTSLVWLQKYVSVVAKSTFLRIVGQLSVQALFIIIREVLTMIPLESLMGSYNAQLANLWNLAYGAICATMSDWIFPGMPLHLEGILTTVGVISINVTMNFFAFNRAAEAEEVINELMNNICDVISGWAFLIIFTFNAFGPNQYFIYIVCDMTQRQKWEAIVMIAINFSVNVVKLIIILLITQSKFDDEFKRTLMAFGVRAMRKWYWLVLWLLVSTCAACGACMVMMHDGMDFSFQFEQWDGTWPFDGN